MKRSSFVVIAVFTSVLLPGQLRASCPQGVPNEIFCDDFDTYCPEGGPPGTPNCASGSTADNEKLFDVWFPLRFSGCYGTDMRPDKSSGVVIADIFSGRYAGAFDMGQIAVRDWVLSDPRGDRETGQVLDIHRLIENVHGPGNNSVNGSDAAPLVMSFMMASNAEKLYYSPGYMELALGDHHDPLNRANTDYIPKSANCCGDVYKPALPIVCAQANPNGTLPVECPDVNVYPPPVHQAIAVGAFTSLDIDPCDGCTAPGVAPQYRQMNKYLTLYDGKLWWTLSATNPPSGATVSGSLTDEAGTPASPPAGFFPWLPGEFHLVSTVGSTTPGYKTQNSQCYNTVTLTIRTTTLSVELKSRVVLKDGSATYIVTSTMDNIPRQYTGEFDRIRAGVGPGCPLLSANDWTACNAPKRDCLENNYELAFVAFDRFLLYGGVGNALTGACCQADGSCALLTAAACAALDPSGNPTGHFYGPGHPCETVNCCPLAYGDTDQDGDVDMDDFARLQACLTSGGPTSASCRCLDYDGVNGIDLDDFDKFVGCASGPGIPANLGPACRAPGW